MSMDLIIKIIVMFLGGLILLYMAIVISSYSSMLLLSVRHLRRNYKIDKRELDETYIDSFYSKPVSIIIPVHNEEAGVIDSISSILNLRYPQTEAIIVNDGSTDETEASIISAFRMVRVTTKAAGRLKTKAIISQYRSEIHPNLWLLTKEQGGKADALNAGINIAKYPYFCSVDGDSILAENSLLRIMRPIMMSNGDVIGAGGNVRIANGQHIEMGSVSQEGLSKNTLVTMQAAEYVRAFLMGRTALGLFNMNLIISGAFSIFSKEWVVEAGGYATNTIGEDMELVVRLQLLARRKKMKKRIAFVSDPICWTEAPESVGVLHKQRRRWHQGLIESLWKNRKALFNPKYGSLGLVAFPYYWIVECLGPIIELAGYIYVVILYFQGGLYYEFSLLLMLLFILYGSLFTAASVLLEAWSMNSYPKTKDIAKLFFLSLTEVFWYRPMTLLWRFEGLIRFAMGKKDWGKMKRVGLSRKGAQR